MALLITYGREHRAETPEEGLAWIRENFPIFAAGGPYTFVAEEALAEGAGQFGPADSIGGALRVDTVD